MDERNEKDILKALYDDERISAYLRGIMTDDEEALFMKQMGANDSLRSRAVAMAYLAKAMKHVGQKRDEDIKEALLSTDERTALGILDKTMRKARVPFVEDKSAACSYSKSGNEAYSGNGHDSYHTHRATSVRLRVRFRFTRAIAAAACLLIIGGLGYKYYSESATASLADRYCSVLSAYDLPPRGAQGNPKAAADLASLFSSVREGDYLEADVKRLAVLWELSTMSTYNDYTDDAPIIGWYLAIAYLKDNDKESAKAVLERLIAITEKNSVVNEKAKELLGEL